MKSSPENNGNVNRRVLITVRGRVQGVFFRTHTKQIADSLGLTGWVRNERDGSVTVLAEGPERELKKLVLWCREGPPAAKVEELKESWETASGEYRGFEIRYQ